jgi:hypothetical protein
MGNSVDLTLLMRHLFHQQLRGNRNGYGSRALSCDSRQADRANQAFQGILTDTTPLQSVYESCPLGG